jgi:DNA-binding transcriptional MerR regulator
MRMRELVSATGVPRTAIHHYQREGLLPPANKTARNAALYGREHVERVKLIRSLRSDALGPFPLEGVRQILEMVDRGVEPEVAAALYALPGGLGKSATSRGRNGERSLSDVAHDAGMSLSTARALHGSGLLLGRAGPGDSRVFDEADAAAARVLAELLAHDAIRAADLEPIAELMGELIRYEQALTSLITAKAKAGEASERQHALFQGLHVLHTYLFSRLVPVPGDA